MRQLYVIIIAGIAASLLIGFFSGFWMLTFIGLTLLAAGIGAYWIKHGRIEVDELIVETVFERNQNRFVRFLPSGVHWINPYREEVRDSISLSSQSTKGSSKGGQTSGGIPVTINWQASFSIKLDKIASYKVSGMARALPKRAGSMVTKHVNHIIHLVLDEQTVSSLIEAGAQAKLEREIHQAARERLDDSGVSVNRIMIDAIQLPKKVQASLAAAHDRELLLEAEARGLERLHSVINRFSDAEMDRLIEIERIHHLGKNGVTMLYPSESNRVPTSKDKLIKPN